MTAEEMAPTGIHETFSPVLCLSREVRWGRTGETFGEDPYLIGEFGAALIKGYQGKGLDSWTPMAAAWSNRATSTSSSARRRAARIC